MMANRGGHLFDGWIIATRNSGLPPPVSFARGLSGDYDAVNEPETVRGTDAEAQGTADLAGSGCRWCKSAKRLLAVARGSRWMAYE